MLNIFYYFIKQLTGTYSYETSSNATTNAAFSIASKLCRFMPLKKNFVRVFAQCVRSAAVKAATFSSPIYDFSVLLRIDCICL